MTAATQARFWLLEALARAGKVQAGSWMDGRVAGLLDALAMIDAATGTCADRMADTKTELE